jgi:uncharacterized protein YjiS (DUF1127 family)
MMEMIMSTILSAILPRDSVGERLPRTIGAALKGWWIAYVNWRVEQLAISRLRSMSDRELKDMGVSRAQIEFAVRGEAAPNPIISRYY